MIASEVLSEFAWQKKRGSLLIFLVVSRSLKWCYLFNACGCIMLNVQVRRADSVSWWQHKLRAADKI